MRVLFVWRGPSPYRVDFFNELGRYCNLTVLFEMKPSDIKDKDITWFHENFDTFKGVYLKGFMFLGKIRLCLDAFKYIFGKKKYDIIVFGMYSTFTQSLCILLCKLFRKKYIINSDGGFIKHESPITKKLKTFLIKDAYGYICSSKGTKTYLQYYGANDNCWVYPFTSTLRINMPTNVSIENKNENKKTLGIYEEIVVLFTGQFIKRKGIDVLLRSCYNFPDNIGVYIVGGEATEEYLGLSEESGFKNIHFISFKTPIQLKQYYMAADIYAFPTREDIWGLVINEAMAYGLAIITTDKCLAGTELITQGVNGFIIPVDNHDALHEKISTLNNDRELLKTIQDNSRKTISEYSIENMALSHYMFFCKNM